MSYTLTSEKEKIPPFFDKVEEIFCGIFYTISRLTGYRPSFGNESIMH